MSCGFAYHGPPSTGAAGLVPSLALRFRPSRAAGATRSPHWEASNYMTEDKLSYDLKCMRLRNDRENSKSHRYRITSFGFRVALFLARTHARLYRPGLAEVLPSLPNGPPADSPLQRQPANIEAEIAHRVRNTKLVAKTWPKGKYLAGLRTLEMASRARNALGE
jgi:hypothetical protein